MRPTLPILAIISLASCTGANPRAGHWVGTITPTAPGPTCEKSRATLDVGLDAKIMFAPTEGTWVLTGMLANGTIVATRSQPGADKKPFVTRLDATVTPTTITGTYATPRCRYDVALAAAQLPK